MKYILMGLIFAFYAKVSLSAYYDHYGPNLNQLVSIKDNITRDVVRVKENILMINKRLDSLEGQSSKQLKRLLDVENNLFETRTNIGLLQIECNFYMNYQHQQFCINKYNFLTRKAKQLAYIYNQKSKIRNLFNIEFRWLVENLRSAKRAIKRMEVSLVDLEENIEDYVPRNEQEKMTLKNFEDAKKIAELKTLLSEIKDEYEDSKKELVEIEKDIESSNKARNFNLDSSDLDIDW